MTALSNIRQVFWQWIESVAAMTNSLLGRVGSQRQVQIVENVDGTCTFHEIVGDRSPNLPDYRGEIVSKEAFDGLPPEWTRALHGSRAEFLLQPNRFLFRPLELPQRASEFLDGIIRSQIDRLTPWTAGEAAYSWTMPIKLPNDRIQLFIAATARAMIAPYLQLAADLNFSSVAVSTIAPASESGAAPLRVFEHHTSSGAKITRIRHALLAVLFVTGLAATTSTGFLVVFGNGLDNEQQQIAANILRIRAAARAGQDAASSSPQRRLEARKSATPSSVIVLEAVSQVLPDHTYLTEFRVEGDKVQLVGITQDAPSLIQLIERSPQFNSATFFAPTTRSSNDPGERFHIEARIKPYFPTGT